MIPDYYQILGVSPDATFESIKRAYRQKAMKYHPDRGGSHAKMIEINKAYEILEDPALRQQYDYARAHPDDSAAQEKSAADSTQASAKAENYPREWAAFERWMNGIARDVKSAKYGQTKKVFFFDWSFPTAGKSTTGWLLIIGGGIVGLIVSILLTADAKNSFQYSTLRFVSMWGGAWIGVWLHRRFGAILPESGSQRKQPDSESHNIVQCPRCSQRLRFPPVTSRIQITCPSCKHVFTHEPTGS